MTGYQWLPSGTIPSSAGSTADPRLWYPFGKSHVVLSPATSMGIGSAPLTLMYEPGFFNWDLSLYKEFILGKERRY
jgi:hypothetical protein